MVKKYNNIKYITILSMLTFSDIIVNSEERPLSDSEIESHYNIHVVPYHTILQNINLIMSNLINGKKLIIRYEFTHQKIGHYVCIFIHNNIINFYDPLAYVPDYEVQNESINNAITILIESLQSVGYHNYNVNRFRHQQMDELINTCGRHCIVRCIFYELDNSQYNIFINSLQHYTPDQTVTLLTLFSNINFHLKNN